jgi:nicotinate-nucleotide--dimethylbenzimidazole phosphoribosyltransferase
LNSQTAAKRDKANSAIDITTAQRVLDQKTKPVGSLGRLEDLAVQLCVLQNTLKPKVDPVRVLIFAADHGVSAEGVSLYPAAVTAQMMHNFASGGAAICVLARQIGASLELIDVGVDADLSSLTGIVHAKVRRGSGNILKQDAMSEIELSQALKAGTDAVIRAANAGVKALILGEMGIANTTTAAALLCSLLNLPANQLVGAGTGVSGSQLAHKQSVVEQSLARAGKLDGQGALRALGGLEIAALTGAMLEAHVRGIPVIVDGFIVTAAAVAAVAISSTDLLNGLFFAHQSAELGHQHALKALNAKPLLDLGLRLGEASGAALAFPLLRAAAAVMSEMASFASAGVDSVD